MSREQWPNILYRRFDPEWVLIVHDPLSNPSQVFSVMLKVDYDRLLRHGMEQHDRGEVLLRCAKCGNRDSASQWPMPCSVGCEGEFEEDRLDQCDGAMYPELVVVRPLQRFLPLVSGTLFGYPVYMVYDYPRPHNDIQITLRRPTEEELRDAVEQIKERFRSELGIDLDREPLP